MSDPLFWLTIAIYCVLGIIHQALGFTVAMVFMFVCSYRLGATSCQK